MTGLVVRGLVARYGKIEALHGVDLDVANGAITCLIGANGAGKTTLLRTLTGLLRPAAGLVTWQGAAITALPAHRVAALGVAHVPEGRQIFATLTVADNLRLGGWRCADAATLAGRRDSVLRRFPRLRERMRQPAGLLSGGEQQMLALGRALMAAPTFLLLDEPSLGLAPRMTDEVFAAVAALRAEGVTVLLVEQNARAALAIADDACVLDRGRVTMAGQADAVARDPAVMAAYLGS